MISGWAHAPTALEPLRASMNALGHVTFTAPGDLFHKPAASTPESETEETHPPSRYADALIKQLAECAAPTVLVGWSTGAMIALETAIKLPEQIRALILINGTPRFSYTDDCPWGASPRTLTTMSKYLSRRPESVLDDFFRRAASPSTPSTTEIDKKTDSALEEGTDSLCDSLAYLRDTDLRPIIGHVPQPCLLLHGKEDEIISVAATSHLHKHMPRSAKITLAGHGHMLPEQGPQETAIYIEQFLSGLPC